MDEYPLIFNALKETNKIIIYSDDFKNVNSHLPYLLYQSNFTNNTNIAENNSNTKLRSYELSLRVYASNNNMNIIQNNKIQKIYVLFTNKYYIKKYSQICNSLFKDKDKQIVDYNLDWYKSSSKSIHIHYTSIKNMLINIVNNPLLNDASVIIINDLDIITTELEIFLLLLKRIHLIRYDLKLFLI